MAWQSIVGHGLAHSGLGEIIKPFTSAVGYVTNSVAPIDVPTPHQLMHAHQKGWLTDRVYAQGAKLHGAAVGIPSASADGKIPLPSDPYEASWTGVYLASMETPTVRELMEIANRWSWPDDKLSAALRHNGFVFPYQRDKIANLRYDIPGPSDMVRFSIRHVFEPDLVKALGYDDEYLPALDVWHSFQGLNYPIWTGAMRDQVNIFELQHGLPVDGFAAMYAAQKVPEPTWARAYWWSHWVVPSPTQGYLMWQRLNPIRDGSKDGPEMRGLNFSYKDLELLLRANDYPPKWRALLAGISRPIPGVRFAREFRRNGVYDFNDLLNWAIRQGYAEADAFDIAQDIETWAQKAAQGKVRREGQAQIRQAYDLGLIDLQQAGQLATQWGVEPDDLGVFLAVAEQDRNNKRAAKVIRAVERQFLTGKVDQQGARNVLVQYGVNANAINDYLADWQVELVSRTRDVAAQKAIQWTCKGIISLAELDRRLTNLGYDAVDRAGMETEAAECQQNLLGKIAQQQVKAQEKTHRAQVAIQRHACQVFQQARRQLASHGTPVQLRKWFCEGTVGSVEVFARLRYLGWTDPDITRLLADCQKGTTSPPPVPGPTVIPGLPPAPQPGTCPPGP